MLITIAGVIGVGKSSMAELLGKTLDTKVVYEPVEENSLLPLFYEDKVKYGFLFQIDMLSQRFEMIQEAMSVNNGILDRSVYEDSIFLDQLVQQGHLDTLSQSVYHKLLNRLLKELEPLPKKSPDLMIVLNCTFEEEINRINKRAREFEKVSEGTELYDYFKLHHANYQKWIKKDLGFPKMVIDTTNIDYVNNESDRRLILEDVVKELCKVQALTTLETVKLLLKLNNKEWNKTNAQDYAMKLYNYMEGEMAFHELSYFTDNTDMY